MCLAEPGSIEMAYNYANQLATQNVSFTSLLWRILKKHLRTIVQHKEAETRNTRQKMRNVDDGA